jgi:hypothetical protein
MNGTFVSRPTLTVGLENEATGHQGELAPGGGLHFGTLEASAGLYLAIGS